jgi:transcriptional regulator with XRE-family HTH domain
MSSTKDIKIHEGRNIKRFREMLGIKQEALAYELGEEWNQKKVSILEQREVVDPKVMQRVSDVLKIPVEAFKNFNEEQAITVISSTFNDNSAVVYNNPVFDPVDKIIQLHEEKIALYERMLKEKDEMMARLEKLVEKGS